MLNEQQLTSLTANIGDKLAKYNYTEFHTGELSGFPFTKLIMTERRWMVRYIMALSQVPSDIQDLKGFQVYFETSRKVLSDRFAKFPWFKEIGTYSVMFCNSDLFDKLAGELSSFKDFSGLHINVMLGCCIVDVKRNRMNSDKTWGLYKSGKHFSAVIDSLDSFLTNPDTKQG